MYNWSNKCSDKSQTADSPVKTPGGNILTTAGEPPWCKQRVLQLEADLLTLAVKKLLQQESRGGHFSAQHLQFCTLKMLFKNIGATCSPFICKLRHIVDVNEITVTQHTLCQPFICVREPKLLWWKWHMMKNSTSNIWTSSFFNCDLLLLWLFFLYQCSFYSDVDIDGRSCKC